MQATYARNNLSDEEPGVEKGKGGAVSLTASQIRQSCNITKKDLRKFLDGIFVSWKGPTPEPV